MNEWIRTVELFADHGGTERGFEIDLPAKRVLRLWWWSGDPRCYCYRKYGCVLIGVGRLRGMLMKRGMR